MQLVFKLVLCASALGPMAARMETTGAGGAASGVPAPPGMVEACIRQIRVGRPDASMSTCVPITAGPDKRILVGIKVDRSEWGCRIEDNGSYTAFPQFAN